jgi:predicted nucleic acid-binding protein
MKRPKIAKRILLSHGVLGLIAHQNVDLRKSVITWFARHMAFGTRFYLPSIVEYAVCIHFSSRNLSKALAELNFIADHSVRVPITTADLQQALAFWARSRRSSKKSNPFSRIDIVHLTAAQAIRLNAVVATAGNSRINQLVDARHWRTLALKWDSKVKRWRTVSVAKCE